MRLTLSAILQRQETLVAAISLFVSAAVGAYPDAGLYYFYLSHDLVQLDREVSLLSSICTGNVCRMSIPLALSGRWLFAGWLLASVVLSFGALCQSRVIALGACFIQLTLVLLAWVPILNSSAWNIPALIAESIRAQPYFFSAGPALNGATLLFVMNACVCGRRSCIAECTVFTS